MNYLKVYKTRSNEAKINFALGDFKVEGHFKNGNIRLGEWATLTTSDGRVQKAIEESPLYNKVVFLKEEHPLDSEEERDAVINANEVKSYPQVEKYLMQNCGVKKTEVRAMNNEKLRKKCEALGLYFPNMIW